MALDVVFADGVAADDAAAAVERIERAIRERFPKITRIYIESRNASICRPPGGSSTSGNPV